MMPIFEEIAQELKDKYKFVKLNVDEARDLAISYGVTSVPTFIFIKDNTVKGKTVGGMSKDHLIAKINELLG
jgi:thioredoxin 1